MSHRVLVLTVAVDVDKLALPDRFDALIPLFWAAPETIHRVLDGYPHAWADFMTRVAEDYQALAVRQFQLAQQMVSAFPQYRGINPLLGWEGTIGYSLMAPLVAELLYEELLRRCGPATEVCFTGECDVQAALAEIADRSGHGVRVVVLQRRQNHVSLVGRKLRALRALASESKHEGHLAPLSWGILQDIDTSYAFRKYLWPSAKFKPGGIWYYGSYINYTRILEKHAKHQQDDAPQWVVNNYSARCGLPNHSSWNYLWQFGADDHSAEHRSFLQKAREVLDELKASRGALDAPVLTSLVDRALPHALAEIDLFDGFLRKAKPQEVWVANQWGSEANLVQLAALHEVPTVQVQHGILEQYYASAPIRSDRFLVWGDFWRQLVSPQSRTKVQVNNPGFDVRPVTRQSTSRGALRVTFFTARVDLLPFWNPEVVLREAVTILDRLLKSGHQIVIRVHPMDTIETWTVAWRALLGDLPAAVRFDKGGPMETLLGETDVALMFFSTVSLNCVASGIPVVSLGWYPFMWRPMLETQGLMQFGSSIDEVVKLVSQAGAGAARPDSLEMLMASTR